MPANEAQSPVANMLTPRPEPVQPVTLPSVIVSVMLSLGLLPRKGRTRFPDDAAARELGGFRAVPFPDGPVTVETPPAYAPIQRDNCCAQPRSNGLRDRQAAPAGRRRHLASKNRRLLCATALGAKAANARAAAAEPLKRRKFCMRRSPFLRSRYGRQFSFMEPAMQAASSATLQAALTVVEGRRKLRQGRNQEMFRQ